MAKSCWVVLVLLEGLPTLVTTQSNGRIHSQIMEQQVDRQLLIETNLKVAQQAHNKAHAALTDLIKPKPAKVRKAKERGVTNK